MCNLNSCASLGRDHDSETTSRDFTEYRAEALPGGSGFSCEDDGGCQPAAPVRAQPAGRRLACSRARHETSLYLKPCFCTGIDSVRVGPRLAGFIPKGRLANYIVMSIRLLYRQIKCANLLPGDLEKGACSLLDRLRHSRDLVR